MTALICFYLHSLLADVPIGWQAQCADEGYWVDTGTNECRLSHLYYERDTVCLDDK